MPKSEEDWYPLNKQEGPSDFLSEYTFRLLTNYEHMLIIILKGGVLNGKADKLQASWFHAGKQLL
jgi:hypothetical protein